MVKVLIGLGSEGRLIPHLMQPKGAERVFGRFGVGSVSEGFNRPNFNDKDNSGQRWEAIIHNNRGKNWKREVMIEERRDKRARWVIKEAEGLVGISNLSAFLQVTRPL